MHVGRAPSRAVSSAACVAWGHYVRNRGRESLVCHCQTTSARNTPPTPRRTFYPDAYESITVPRVSRGGGGGLQHVRRFHRGLVIKARGLLYHLILGSRVIKEKNQ